MSGGWLVGAKIKDRQGLMKDRVRERERERYIDSESETECEGKKQSERDTQ